MVRSFTFSTSLSLPKSLIQIQQYLCSERGFLKDFTKGKENKSSSLQYLIVACSFPHIFLCISLIQMQPYVVFDCLSPISLTMECWVFFFFSERQFHYAVFFAYMRLKEQEIRNLMWISECVAQNQKSRVHDSVVFIF